CGRGEQENRIKELKLDLASGRTSCHRFLANQCRLVLHVAASVLVCALQHGLTGSRLQNAQAGTVRLKLLKVGAQAKEPLRKFWFHMSSSFVNRDLRNLLYHRLCATWNPALSQTCKNHTGHNMRENAQRFNTPAAYKNGVT
ncbi:MAG TPA: transposase, partial [Chthonomonadales bacterium]|nr:transposase [Chthonomonadales bacterium]